MAQEVERKFLVAGDFKPFAKKATRITQGYLSSVPERTVRVHKQRFGYMVNNTICEVGNVLINGAQVVTINSESTEIEDIKKTIADCGLEGVENINYLQAIKRVIGMSVKPLANE